MVKTLEADALLVGTLGHNPLANSVARGSRIFGFDTRLENIPEACIVVSFADGPPLTPGTVDEWNLTLDIYAPDVYGSADLLDHLERIGRDWRSTLVTNPAMLLLFRIGSHQALETGDARLIVTRVALVVRWA